MTRLYATVLAIAGLLFCAAASAQVQRTFVKSTGNDANTATNCGFTAPCRSFTAAQTVTQSGGEIIALDAAGYGAITITKSLSILANPGAYAGISASSGSAVTIATAGVNVRLSGLKLNGIGASHGILMTDGSSLTVENCTVSGFSTIGIAVGGPIQVRILNSLVTASGLDGILIDGGTADVVNTRLLANDRIGIFSDATTGTGTRVAVTDSVASRNTYGFAVRANDTSATASMSVSGSTADNGGYGFYALITSGTAAIMNVASSKATGNVVGFANAANPGDFRSAGNNLVIDNDTNAGGTITNIGTM